MKKRTALVMASVLVASVLLSKCTHELPIDLNPPSPDPPVLSDIPCSPDSVYFLNEIRPLIISSCAIAGCHDAITHEEDLNLTTYENIIRLVVKRNSGESKLYKVITARGEDIMPPPPHSALTLEQTNSIKKWIDQGAFNNSCNSCDSSNILYSAGILPLFKNQCTGCHNSSNPGGNIDLTNFTKVREIALNGVLLGSLEWKPGFAAMPQGGAKLSECEINRIKQWIAAGALNN